MSNVRHPSNVNNDNNNTPGLTKGSNSGSQISASGGRKSLLIEYVDKQVSIITNDGRNLTGFMRGFDQVCNIIIEKCIERVFSTDIGVKMNALGLYVVRGDNIAVIGEIDLEKDKQIAWPSIKVSFHKTNPAKTLITQTRKEMNFVSVILT